MSTILKKSVYDRLFPKEERISWLQPQWRSEVSTYEKKYFHGDFFGRSVILKDVKRRLSLVRMDWRTYKAWKGIGFVSGVSIGILILLIGGFSNLFSFFIFTPLVLAILGFILPELYVLDKENYRNYKINSEFPNLLDLLKLYSESAAFETFGSALYDISQNMRGVLGEELRDLTSRYRFMSLTEFLKLMENRFSEPLAQDLVSTVRLAEEYGGSVAQKIATLAEEAHKDRLQKAREIGQKSSVSLMVPLLLFHFPVAMVVFLLPLILTIMKLFNAS